MKPSQVQSLLREIIIIEYRVNKIDLSIQERAIFIREKYKLLLKRSLQKVLKLLDNKNKEAFFDIVQKQNIEYKYENFKEIYDFITDQNIDFIVLFKEEVIIHKVELMRGKHKAEKREEFVEMIVENLLDTLIDSEIIPKDYEIFSDPSAKITTSISYNPVKKYLTKQQKRQRLKVKLLTGIIPLFLTPILLFIFYFVIYFLHYYNYIKDIPSWAQEIPNFIKYLVRLLFP